MGIFSLISPSRTTHGFLYTDGSFIQLDPPGSVAVPYPSDRFPGKIDINDQGQIAGSFLDQDNRYHGFLYTPATEQLQISTPALGDAAVGLDGSSQVQIIKVKGGTPPYHWSTIANSNDLPARYDLNSSTGALQILATKAFYEQPLKFGTYSFRIDVTDSSSPPQIVSKDFTWNVVCGVPSQQDTDRDSLEDCWELGGIDVNGDNIIDLDLPALGALPDKKDIFVEIDWMEKHEPSPEALFAVIRSFENAPPVDNPDGTNGIRLHLYKDEEAIPHNDDIAFPPYTEEATSASGVRNFPKDVRDRYFGTAAERDPTNKNTLAAKSLAFHYALFAHGLFGLPSTTGVADPAPRGQSFIVSLGTLGAQDSKDPDMHRIGNTYEQAWTFMHELGHNLGLQHGGGNEINCKPNYLSIMNYTYGSYVLPEVPNPLGRIDYSRKPLPTLNEYNLSEIDGIGGSSGDRTAFGVKTSYYFDFKELALKSKTTANVIDASGKIDWNENGEPNDVGVSADINRFQYMDAFLSGCDGSGTELKGYDDWANLVYNFRLSSNFNKAAFPTVYVPQGVDLSDAEKISPDIDNDGVVDLRDNCPLIANADQKDSDGDLVGDACDNCPEVKNGGQWDKNNNGIGDLCDNCANPELDTDGDGLPDCMDTCPTVNNIKDPDCDSHPDIDADGDGIPNGTDNCPTVQNADQINSDGDSLGDACDGCSNDPIKVQAGFCGCGRADTDSDGDGVADCNDQCPADPQKTTPGACGCGVPDTACPLPVRESCGNCKDDDGDGLADLLDPDCHAVALALERGRLSLDPDPDDGKLSLRGSFSVSPSSINPPAQGVTVNLTDGDGPVICLSIPPGAGWKTVKGPTWVFKDKDGVPPGGSEEEKLRIEFDPKKNAYQVQLKLKEAQFSDPDAGNISTSLSIGEKGFLNKQVWLGKAKGRKLTTP